jgi:16S rRNA (cytosine967-C5)-methyltransferase
MWLAEYESPRRVENLLDALNQRPRFCIRANTLRTDAKTLAGKLEGYGFVVEIDKDLPDVLFIDAGNGGMPLETELYKEGFFSVQDKASRIAAEALGAQKGETVIDACAAPGGKTMAMAEAMKNSGRILALDIHEHKMDLIKAEAARLGASVVETKVWDSREPISEFRGKADRTLVDVPCSGLGAARRKPEVKYKEFDAAMEGLPRLQLDILRASAQYVKPGGVLVYSTCTIAKRENEEVVDAFLSGNNEFTKIDSIQLLPMSQENDGFFICKLIRS